MPINALPEWRPFALVNTDNLAEDMLLRLPAVLNSYSNSLATWIQKRWSAIVEDAEVSDSDSEETGVTVYWVQLFQFLKLLCCELECQLSGKFQITDQRVRVRMDWSLVLNHENRIGGEAKTEAVLQHQSTEMEALSEVPWLGWEWEIDTAAGGCVIILKVSQLYLVPCPLDIFLDLCVLSTNRAVCTSAARYVACCQRPTLGHEWRRAALPNHSV